MINYRKYNEVGHTCERTWRVAMTVAAVLVLMKDDPDAVRAFTYDTEADDVGLDPWRLIDGINPLVKEPQAELWFDNGGSKIVDLSQVVYVQQPHKARGAQCLAKEYAMSFVQGRYSLKELAVKCTTNNSHATCAYLALAVASYLPDDFELKFRQELLRVVAASSSVQ
jgi:hypothetical protein